MKNINLLTITIKKIIRNFNQEKKFFHSYAFIILAANMIAIAACNSDATINEEKEDIISVITYNIAYDNDFSNTITLGPTYSAQSLEYYTLSCRAKRLMA